MVFFSAYLSANQCSVSPIRGDRCTVGLHKRSSFCSISFPELNLFKISKTTIKGIKKMHILDTSPTFLLALSATVLSIPAHVEADHYQLSSHSITKILSIVSNDTSVANYISDIYGPDNPQVEPIDEAVIDWWYFDVVSDDLHTSADAFFYATPILVGDGEHTLFVSFSARFPDGTSFNANVTAESATVVTDGNGSAGFFEGTGFEWSSTPDLSHYVVKIDSPELGIKGTISMKSVSNC
jgi:hypothetical protein